LFYRPGGVISKPPTPKALPGSALSTGVRETKNRAAPLEGSALAQIGGEDVASQQHRQTVSFEELAYSNMLTLNALVELWDERGIVAIPR
jgi:hypothetical protein